MSWKQIGLFALVMSMLTNSANAAPIMRITEWMYNGSGAGSTDEFVEFTNLDIVPVNMIGWSFDDNSRTPGSQSLSGFGIVQPGQSVLLTDLTAAQFRTAWNLPGTVVVVGGNTNNLGRADEINLYDNTNTLVDRLTYDDQTLGGGRTNTQSGNPNSLAVLGANNSVQWTLSANGDSYGSYTAIAPAAGDKGNPGSFSLFSVPEPNSVVLLLVGAVACFVRRGRR